MKARYTDEAMAEVEDILSHIAMRSPKAAEVVDEVIEMTVARISSFPYSAQATDEAHVRMAPAGRSRT